MRASPRPTLLPGSHRSDFAHECLDGLAVQAGFLPENVLQEVRGRLGELWVIARSGLASRLDQR